MTTDSPPFEVLIAGGSVAGLEAALALRDLAADRVHVTLLSPSPEFVYRPMTVREPFAFSRAARYPIDRIARDLGAEWREDALERVISEKRQVRTAAGETLAYDALLVAVGARPRARYEHVVTIDDRRLDELLHGLVQDVEDGFVKRLAFLAPPRIGWVLPLYELAMMTAARAEDMNVETAITILTPEDAPLAVFGQEVSDGVARLLAKRRIEVVSAAYCEVPRSGVVEVTPGERRYEFDRIVALPELDGPAVPGVAATEDGFLSVDEHCAVQGADRIWAAGDAVQFPVKHGGISSQQADVAAAAIARLAGAEVPKEVFAPEIRGMLLTGGAPLYLSALIGDRHGAGSRLSEEPLWEPAGKIAARHLAPYLETL